MAFLLPGVHTNRPPSRAAPWEQALAVPGSRHKVLQGLEAQSRSREGNRRLWVGVSLLPQEVLTPLGGTQVEEAQYRSGLSFQDPRTELLNGKHIFFLHRSELLPSVSMSCPMF